MTFIFNQCNCFLSYSRPLNVSASRLTRGEGESTEIDNPAVSIQPHELLCYGRRSVQSNCLDHRIAASATSPPPPKSVYQCSLFRPSHHNRCLSLFKTCQRRVHYHGITSAPPSSKSDALKQLTDCPFKNPRTVYSLTGAPAIARSVHSKRRRCIRKSRTESSMEATWAMMSFTTCPS